MLPNCANLITDRLNSEKSQKGSFLVTHLAFLLPAESIELCCNLSRHGLSRIKELPSIFCASFDFMLN